MKKVLFLSLIVIFVATLTSCNEKQYQSNQPQPEVNVTTSVNPSDGLDVKLVGALIQEGKCSNAEDLEKEINKEGGINNLDLDGDGKIDYINVTENDSKGNKTARSFDLTTGKDGDVTHIATIDVEKVGNEYNINMAGNEQIYGAGYYHTMHCGPSFGEMMFFHWLFMPRPVYYHPYYYPGYYPRYYGVGYSRPVVVSRSVYSQRTSTQRTVVTKTVTKSTPKASVIKSSNTGKVSTSTRKSISDNTQKQRQFQSRDANKSVNKGGFTKKSSSGSSSYSGSSSKKSSGGFFSSGSSSGRSGFGRSSSSGRSSGGRRR
jgi:hypothetical protein